MAKYERAILEPYLRDVCYIELDYSNLQKELRECEQQIRNLRVYLGDTGEQREKPNRMDYHKVGPVFTEIWHIVVGFVVAAFFGWLGASILAGVAIVYSLLCGLLIVLQVSGEIGRYNKDEAAYQEYLDSIEPGRRKLKTLEYDRDCLLKGIEEAEKVRKAIYAADIIAKQFRNVAAVSYIYDYYTTSGETDLDRIIQTMLLSGILDRENQAANQRMEILMNQRIEIANQEALSAQIADNHRLQMERLAQMERNQRVQQDYQNMIATNQMVTNYILYKSYKAQKEK